MTDNNLTDVTESAKDTVRLLLGHSGRMIAGSKSAYRKCFPKNLIVFNANVVVEGLGKVWHGDFDLTRDEALLVRLAELTDREVYVLPEMAARFENEKSPKLSQAVYKVSRVKMFSWHTYVGEVKCKFYARHRRSGIIQEKTKQQIEKIWKEEEEKARQA